MVSGVLGLSERWRLVRVSRFCARGLWGRSFLHATVPLPVPSWTPAERRAYPRSGTCVPDTDEVDSTALRNSSPLYNRNYAGPKRPGPGDTSSWRGAAGIRSRPGAANQHRHKSRFAFSHGVLFMLCLPDLGGGQGNGGNRPERRARARRGMRAGRLVRPCSFVAQGIPL